MVQQNQRFPVRRLKKAVIAILAVLTVLALYGCGSSRKAAYSEGSTVREDTTWKNLSYLHGTKVRLTDLAGTDMGVKIRYTKYDTGKPKDKETGLPPVEEEGEVELDFSQDRKTDVSVADSTHAQADIKRRSKTETDWSAESVTEREGTNTIRDLKGIAVCLLFLSVIFIIYRRKG